LTIPAVLWYAVALYYVPPNFMGWPTKKWTVNNHDVIVRHIEVREGKAIYFVIIDYNMKNVRKMLSPGNAFFPYIDDTPRLYEVPYNSKVHKAILDMQMKIAKRGRGILKMDMDAMAGISKFSMEKVFKLVDPMELLKKDEDTTNQVTSEEEQ
jgi:hypothetical protein